MTTSTPRPSPDARRLTAAAVALVTLLVAVVITAAAPRVSAQQAPDRSEVVIVLDFSASILQDRTNRTRFAAALDRIADRVDAISADLVAGDARISIIQFASRARDYPRCVDLRTFESPANVSRFADCLRRVADAYRRGLEAGTARPLGVDTNYVAAMEAAARHLPADSVRPALILLTDGKHDVPGTPVSRVRPARDRLFGDRSPFALLPVGMGLAAGERAELKRGLDGLRLVRDMPACVSGATFEWAQTTFNSAAEAGNAVAVALQNVTCTFTVAPTPTPPPTPTPTPVPTPNVVRNLDATPGDGTIELSWSAPQAAANVQVVDYEARCRTGGGDWIVSTEGVSLATTTVIEGLTNGADYECEVAAVAADGPGVFRPAAATVRPVGRPAAPAKPSVAGADGAARISVPPDDGTGITDYKYECSSDAGATWPATVDAKVGEPSAEVTGLTNGTEYVCRAFATNTSGTSDASPVSDAFRPCSSMLECNPILQPILLGLGGVLALALLGGVFFVYRGRARDYVVAVVDVVHTANLGHGNSFSVNLRPTGIERVRRGKADVQLRYLGHERFHVVDRNGERKQEVTAGRPIRVVDGRGAAHDLVLWAFSTPSAAAAQAGRR
jgi:hypothetical protein